MLFLLYKVALKALQVYISFNSLLKVDTPMHIFVGQAIISEKIVGGADVSVYSLECLREFLVAIFNLFLVDGEKTEFVEEEVFSHVVRGPFVATLLLHHLLPRLSIFIK